MGCIYNETRQFYLDEGTEYVSRDLPVQTSGAVFKFKFFICHSYGEAVIGYENLESQTSFNNAFTK